jgi:membrane fusion protein (multidrug efflux system)
MNIAVDESIPKITQARHPALGKRSLLIIGAVAGAFAMLAFALHWFTQGRYLEQTDDAYVRVDWVPVSPKVAGYVAQVLVEDDQPVKAGDILLRIEARDYRAYLDQARAEQAQADAALASSQASLAVASSQIAEQQAALEQARALLQSARAEQGRASLDQRRYEALVKDNAASTQRLESARASSAQAAAAVQGTLAAQRRQATQLQVTQAREQLAQAAVEQAKARQAKALAGFQLASNALEDSVIRAPIDGVVGQRRVRQRQYVAPGQPLLAVVPVQQAYIVANYKETQLQRMRVGQPVDVAIDSYSGRRLHAHVASFSPGSGAVFALLPSDNATGNFTKIVQRFPVRILLDNVEQGGPVLPGMSVVTTVDTRDSAQAERHGE